jgi:hypothetical protein
MITLLQVLGGVMMLGAMAHSIGVLRLYLAEGMPEANRIIIDVWVAEAQALTGALYLAAARAARNREHWRAPAAFGAINWIGFAAVMLPVLIARAPLLFRIPVTVYLAASAYILVRAALIQKPARQSADSQ